MHFLTDRHALAVAVRATAKLSTKAWSGDSNFGRVLFRPDNGMLRASATNATTHVDVYLPAELGGDVPLRTKSKEFGYLLKKLGDGLVHVGPAAAPDEGMVTDQTGQQHIFPIERGEPWDDHPAGEPHPFATIDLDGLSRALYLADDFINKTEFKPYHGLHVEPTRDSLRFCATNGHMLTVADIRTGVRALWEAEEPLYIEYPAVRALIELQGLWDGHEDVDCEIRVVKRWKTQEDGDRWELDPVAIFDIAGGGIRAVVSTMARGRFAEYRKVMVDPNLPGVLVTVASEQVLNLCKQAVKAAGKAKAKVGFRFFYDTPTDGAMLRVGYARYRDPPDEAQPYDVGFGCGGNKQPYDVVLEQLDGYCAHVHRTGMEQLPEEHVADSRIVGMDPSYLAVMVKHLGPRAQLKFHGSVGEVVATSVDQPDDIYCIAMPLAGVFTKEEL